MNLLRKACCTCMIIVSLAGSSAADVLVNFEATTFPNGQDHQYGAIFNGLSVIGRFPSYAVSSRTTPSNSTFGGAYYSNGDDSAVASAGATGSSKWLAAFNYLAGDVVFSADSGSIISKVNVNNTALVDFTLRNGLGGFSRALTNNGDYFKVRFVGFNDLLQRTSTTDWLTLGSKTDGTLSVLSIWTEVNLSVLNANKIGFEFDGSDKNSAGLLTPTYLAFDNFVITAVPEPGSFGLVAVAILACGLRRRKAGK